MSLQGITFVGGPAGGSFAIAVPDVRNKPVAEAKATIEGLELRVNEVSVVGSGTEGTVYNQRPVPPATLTKGAVVTLEVIKKASPPPADVITAIGSKLDAQHTVVVEKLAALETVAVEGVKGAVEEVKAAEAAHHDEVMQKLNDMSSGQVAK